MSRRHFYKHRHKEEDVDVTALLNILVVIIAFLILSAVFSRIGIQEINLPTQSGGGGMPDKLPFAVEVILRKNALEISDGRNVVATIPKTDGKYDVRKLSEHLLRIKAEHSDKEDATLLLEPDIEYEYLIEVMDVIKSAETRPAGSEALRKITLFPQVSIGDAP